MNDLNQIKTLCNLETRFKQIEEMSSAMLSTPDKHYLVVRLDGIGLSKKYLKNDISNKRFKSLMKQALQKTYYLLHRKSPTDTQQIFLAMVIASDEVSFILNTFDNYYDHRLFKIVTTIASTFSCLFTSFGGVDKPSEKMSGAFDGRPLVLSNLQDVNDYIAHRAAVYIRNSLGKILRINGVENTDLYHSNNHNNLDYYQGKFEQLNLDINGYTEQLAKNVSVFVPCCKDDKQVKEFKNKSLEKLINLFSSSIINFEEWLKLQNISNPQ